MAQRVQCIATRYLKPSGKSQMCGAKSAMPTPMPMEPTLITTMPGCARQTQAVQIYSYSTVCDFVSVSANSHNPPDQLSFIIIDY